MKDQQLRYYLHDGPNSFLFELIGELNQEGTRRLDQDWTTASSSIGERSRNVDITSVTGTDEHGRALLARWHREGTRIIAKSAASRALAESIPGDGIFEAPEQGGTIQRSDRGRAAVSRSFLAPVVPLLPLLAALLFPVSANAATLKPETVSAWNEYVQGATERFQQRIHTGGGFLWTFEDPERASSVHSGDVVVVSVTGQNPKKVPNGLIHHWIGAVFLPGVKLHDALEVTRDYDRYKEFYRPSVIDSKALGHDAPDDTFSMLLMNRVFFSKMALDADYRATTVRLDDCRVYSISKTTRVQEIQEYGQEREHKLPEGEGGGYIWSLYSISRFEQHDDGVYVELEAIALSRGIPMALHFMADPIVRRISRNALLTLLQQTDDAVRGVNASSRGSKVLPTGNLNGFAARTQR